MIPLLVILWLSLTSPASSIPLLQSQSELSRFIEDWTKNGEDIRPILLATFQPQELKFAEILNRIDAYGETIPAIMQSSPTSKKFTIHNESLHDSQVYVVRKGSAAARSSFALEVQRLALPSNWSESSVEDALELLDTLSLPFLTSAVEIMTEQNKYALFRREFNRYCLLFTSQTSPTRPKTDSMLKAFTNAANHFYRHGTSSPKFVIVPQSTYPREGVFARHYLGGEIGIRDEDLVIYLETKGDLGDVRYEIPQNEIDDGDGLIRVLSKIIGEKGELGDIDAPSRQYLRPRTSPINSNYLEEGLASGIHDIDAGALLPFILEHTNGKDNAVVLLYSPECPHSRKALPLFSLISTENKFVTNDKGGKTTYARMDSLFNDIDVFFGGEKLCPGYPSIINFQSERIWRDYREALPGQGISKEGILEFSRLSWNEKGKEEVEL